jgi:hypothetical protein
VEIVVYVEGVNGGRGISGRGKDVRINGVGVKVSRG